ncbi:MAG TPA: thermonuclease family protein [bacterium]|nr:thermonuclease family protein [bacterium]
MKRLLLLILLLAAPAGLLAKEDWQWVQKIYDGDTLRLKGGQKVRLLGIDTPELHPSEKLYRDARRSHQDAAKIQELGAQSYEVTRELLKGRLVRLELDETTRDKYGRILAYVYFKMPEDRFAAAVGQPYAGKLPAEEKEYMANRELVRYGWATTFKNFEFREKKDFLKLEKKARDAGWGLWGKGPE